MDDLVLAGTLAVTGFYASVLLIIGGLLYVFFSLWNAWIAGKTGLAILGMLVIIFAVLGYISAGLWLRRTGCI
jgi:hypothetical protein